MHRREGLHRLRRRVPTDVLRINEVTRKAYMAYDECWYCMPCQTDCQTGAVTVNIPYLLK